MTILKTERKAIILCAIAYYDVSIGYPVFKIQLRYNERKDDEKGVYQVIVFKFNSEKEMQRCIEEVKAVLGVKSILDIKNKLVNIEFYKESISDNNESSEITKLIYLENKKIWYPMDCGIADLLLDYQTIFIY